MQMISRPAVVNSRDMEPVYEADLHMHQWVLQYLRNLTTQLFVWVNHSVSPDPGEDAVMHPAGGLDPDLGHADHPDRDRRYDAPLDIAAIGHHRRRQVVGKTDRRLGIAVDVDHMVAKAHRLFCRGGCERPQPDHLDVAGFQFPHVYGPLSNPAFNRPAGRAVPVYMWVRANALSARSRCGTALKVSSNRMSPPRT